MGNHLLAVDQIASPPNGTLTHHLCFSFFMDTRVAELQCFDLDCPPQVLLGMMTVCGLGGVLAAWCRRPARLMDLHARDDPCLSMQCSQRLSKRARRPWFGCTRLSENWGKAQERQAEPERQEARDTPGRLTYTQILCTHPHAASKTHRPQPTPHHTARYPPRDFVYYLLRRGTPRTCRVDGNSYAPLR